ncbi:MAG: flagellar motor protein MotB [Alphaproteobacteria bacterium]
MADAGNPNQQPIIIKKVKGHGHGHHGGAWKVAYADFVTAMMAFFLLLWLLNATTEEQRSGIADYFSPESIASPGSGSGSILGGTTIAIDGNKVSAGGPTEGASVPLPPLPSGDGEGGVEGDLDTAGDGGETEFPENGSTQFAENGETDKPDDGTIDESAIQQAMAKREQAQFEAAADALRQAIESVPELAQLEDSLLIEQTPEGLRIQLVDQAGYSMFALGSSQPNAETRKLVQLVSRVVNQLSNKISISGHTDSRGYRSAEGYTNWELSSDRANAARRLLIESGLGSERIALVQGRADTDPLLPSEPESEQNRRISIVLLRENEVPLELDEKTLGIDSLPAAPSPAAPGTNDFGANDSNGPAVIEPARKTEIDNHQNSG